MNCMMTTKQNENWQMFFSPVKLDTELSLIQNLAKAPATITYEPMTQFAIPMALYCCSGFLEASSLTVIYTHHGGWHGPCSLTSSSKADSEEIQAACLYIKRNVKFQV